MPKLREDPVVAARAAFQREVRTKRAYYDVQQEQVARRLGIKGPRMSALMSAPDDISIGRLREMVQMLRLDLGVVATMIGYDQKAIKKFREGDG